jgi:hypothetical protein
MPTPPRIRSHAELVALQRCKSEEAYKALAAYFDRTGKLSRKARLRAAETAKKGRAA